MELWIFFPPPSVKFWRNSPKYKKLEKKRRWKKKKGHEAHQVLMNMFSVNYKWVFEKKEKEKKRKRKWLRLCVKWAKFGASEISEYTKWPLQTHTEHSSEQSQAQP